MTRKRIKLILEVDLDPILGTFSTAASAHEQVLRILQGRISHYNPEVSFEGFVEPPKYMDGAVYIQKEDMEPGGRFFMHNEAVVGWYLIRSTDPEKRDLFLPPHLFHKCFRFVDESTKWSYPPFFVPVEEIV